MRHYHDLTVIAVDEETADSRRVTLDVPDNLRDTFAFQAGQHLPVSAQDDGEELRRTYSLCSTPGEWPLQLGIRVQPHGKFSNFVARRLKAGDVLAAMPPSGRFHLGKSHPAHVALFAGGSGITPILSMAKTLLQTSESTTVSLFYANRKQSTVMFVEDLFALKNQFPDRLQMQFLFSREDQEFDILAGRLDKAKTDTLCECFFGDTMPDVAYICGPGTMIESVQAALAERGMADDAIHFESFGVQKTTTPTPVHVDDGAADAEVTVILDGHRKSFPMARDGLSIVDAAAAHGIDLPYSCKGGVCATCRTHVQDGEVSMARNFGLEDWEVEAGFVLACQCVPVTDSVVLDYDKA